MNRNNRIVHSVVFLRLLLCLVVVSCSSTVCCTVFISKGVRIDLKLGLALEVSGRVHTTGTGTGARYKQGRLVLELELLGLEVTNCVHD